MAENDSKKEVKEKKITKGQNAKNKNTKNRFNFYNQEIKKYKKKIMQKKIKNSLADRIKKGREAVGSSYKLTPYNRKKEEKRDKMLKSKQK